MTLILSKYKSVGFSFTCISTYINTKMSVCVSVCVFAFFSAISKQIGKPFGTKLLFAPEKVLTQKYISYEPSLLDN